MPFSQPKVKAVIIADKGFKILVYNDAIYRSKRSFFRLLSEKLSVWSTESEKFPPSVILLVTIAHWIPAAVAYKIKFTILRFGSLYGSGAPKNNGVNIIIDEALKIYIEIAKLLKVKTIKSTKWGVSDSIAVKTFHELYSDKITISRS